MAQDAELSSANLGAPGSFHGEDGTKECDRWKLHSDTSTISSRVTTPDPILSSSPLLRPFASISSRTSLASRVSILPPQTLLPPTAPSMQEMERGLERGYRRGRGRGRGRLFLRNPNGVARHRPGPDDSSRCDPSQPLMPSVDLAQLPPPPPSPHTAPSGDGHVARLPYLPNRLTRGYRMGLPAARENLGSSQATQTPGDMEQLAQSTIPRPQNEQACPRSPRSRRNSRQSHPFRQQSSGANDESRTFSSTTLGDNASWSSASSSDEDPIAYRNARHFPPQLPAGPVVYGSSALRDRSSATHQIAAWVSRYEKSQSPIRSQLGEVPQGTHPAETGSRADDSLNSDDSSHDEIQLLWQQLKEKRTKSGKIKTEMRARRKELRDKRREKDAADNAFMSIIRPMLVNEDGLRYSINLLEPRVEKMQRLRDECQVLESSYENLEVMLDEEEGDLGILETRFFSILAAGQTKPERRTDVPREPEDDNFSDDSETPYELRGISRDGPLEEPHPLYVELTSTIGDLVLAQEEYEDLLAIKERFEYDQGLKKTTGQKLSDEMKEFFDEFPSEEWRMRDAVIRHEAEVERLKKLCQERRVMKKHPSIQIEYALEPQVKYENMELDDKETILLRHKTLAHAEFHELLSQPDHVLASPEPLTLLGALRAATRLPNDHPEKGLRKRLASKEYAIDSLMRDYDGGKKADYVNRWLLHQLRLSPLNAVLLRSTFLANRSLKIRDMWRWQCDVMHYWWRDNTMSVKDGSSDPITSHDSECSSRLGTPQLSRAASDGGLRPNHHHRLIDSSDAMTVHG